MGFSEIFAMLASYEYAYFSAPRTGETLFMSLRFCSMGIASFIGAAYLANFPIDSSRPTPDVSMTKSKKLSSIIFCSMNIFSNQMAQNIVRILISISSVLPVFNSFLLSYLSYVRRNFELSN